MQGVDVDDVVQFNRVLLAGTPLNTVVGRPFVQNMRVIAAVEEQIRDATTYIYKRKRASGYRRFRGFRAVWLNPLCASGGHLFNKLRAKQFKNGISCRS